MSIRSIVRDRILTSTALTDVIPADRWKAASSITEAQPPLAPFAVMRLGNSIVGMGNVRRIPLEFWVHDEQGTYTRIDSILSDIRAILDGVVHLTDSEGNEIMSADWVSDSGDLNDPGFRTIVKTTNYDLVGKGA